VTHGPVKRHHPKSTLAQKAARPGGVMAETAIAAATKNLAGMRGESEKVLLDTLDALDALIVNARDGKLAETALAETEAAAIRIYALAGMFEMRPLARAALSLAGLVALLKEAGKQDVSGVVVHTQAMRLLAPHEAPVAADEEAKIFQGLARMRAHYAARKD